MRTTKRPLAIAAVLAFAGWMGWDARPAHAQMRGTYADFPFQQGSAFYSPRGNVYSNPSGGGRAYQPYTYSAPARAPVYAAPAQPYVYSRPATSPRYYYNYQTRQWYYYR